MYKPVVFAAMLVALSACASQAPVPLTVAGRADGADVALKRKHAVLPADGDTAGVPFEEVAAHVTRALQGSGFVTVDDPKAADVLIFVSYGEADREMDENYLALAAYDARGYAKNSKARQTWMVQVTSPGKAGKLRKTLPAMVRAAQPQLGKTTPPSVFTLLSRKDPGVRYIETGEIAQ
ncbi:MAG: hypothetical protein WCY15_01720 [Phenylobacterium sp.]|jgi:hypothetical protein|uniref:hypothetical protein n=1 Tax=Phenylobacterium sp. TaxID=1871053 RepID=UPI002A2C7A07|nr:hypothetical protein [Phenylobacterium sp.]MDD3838418.1 hypothetical protein [Phenylobacterium sp.]MDX9998293.1 hypothetical protein [Phenylobacterium sp.]